MKLFLFVVFCLMICVAADCKKRRGDCHESIIVKNNSADTIVFALRSYNSGSLCQLQGEKISPKQEINWQLYDCWEEHLLPPNNVLEIYIVDPEKFNLPQIFYPCDSIEFKNKILEHYYLTIDSLLKYNFIVNFP